MKINIYSENIFLKMAFEELIAFVKNAEVICAQKIVIIDLTSFNEHSIESLIEFDICHMILLSETQCIQEWLGGKNFSSKMHVMSSKPTLAEFLKKIVEIFNEIRMRKCFCSKGTYKKNDSGRIIKYISQREREVLKYYLNRCSTREISAKVGISSKSVSAYKNSAMKKMMLSGNVFQLTKAIHQIVMLEKIVNLRKEYISSKSSGPLKCDLIMIQDALR